MSYPFKDLKKGKVSFSVESGWLVVRTANQSQRYRLTDISGTEVVRTKESGTGYVVLSFFLFGIGWFLSQTVWYAIGAFFLLGSFFMPTKTTLVINLYKQNDLVFASNEDELSNLEQWIDQQLALTP